MNDVEVNVEVEVNPTEDIQKVKQAIENIFGVVSYTLKSRIWGQLLLAQSSGTTGLTKFSNLLKREQIQAAARKVFLSQMTEKSITFYLNKQVAYAGHISFCQQTAESPLGPIYVKILHNNPLKLINWLAPKTQKRKKNFFHIQKE
jgi:predicted RNA binding protein with dsRBD fold (UPF0201 family)